MSVAAVLRIILNAKDEASKSFDAVAKSSVKAHEQIERLKGSWKSTMTMVGASYGMFKDAFGAISRALMSPIKMALDADKAFQQMNRTIANAGLAGSEAANGLKEYVEMMELKTGADSKVIYGIINQNVAYGMNIEQSKTMIEAARALSKVSRDDLGSSVDMLTMTLTGNLRGIKRYVPEVQGLAKDTLKYGTAVDVVIERLVYLNKVPVNDPSAVIRKTGTMMEQLEKRIGEIIISGVDWKGAWEKISRVMERFAYIIENNRAAIVLFTQTITDRGISSLDEFANRLEKPSKPVSTLSKLFSFLFKDVDKLDESFSVLSLTVDILWNSIVLASQYLMEFIGYITGSDSILEKTTKNIARLKGVISDAADEIVNMGKDFSTTQSKLSDQPIDVKIKMSLDSANKDDLEAAIKSGKNFTPAKNIPIANQGGAGGKSLAPATDAEVEKAKADAEKLATDKKRILQEIDRMEKTGQDSLKKKRDEAIEDSKAKQKEAEQAGIKKAEEFFKNRAKIEEDYQKEVQNLKIKALSDSGQEYASRQLKNKADIEEAKRSQASIIDNRFITQQQANENLKALKEEQKANEKKADDEYRSDYEGTIDAMGSSYEDLMSSQKNQASIDALGKLSLMQEEHAKAKTEREAGYKAQQEDLNEDQKNMVNERYISEDKASENILKLKKKQADEELKIKEDLQKNLKDLIEKVQTEQITSLGDIGKALDDLTSKGAFEGPVVEGQIATEQAAADTLIKAQSTAGPKAPGFGSSKATDSRYLYEKVIAKKGDPYMKDEDLKKFDQKVNDLSASLGSFSKGLPDVISSVGGIFGGLGSFFAQLVNMFSLSKEEFKFMFDTIFTQLNNLLPNILQNIPELVESVFLGFTDLLYVLFTKVFSMEFFKKIYDALAKAVVLALDSIFNLLFHAKSTKKDDSEIKEAKRIAAEKKKIEEEADKEKNTKKVAFGSDKADMGDSKFKIRDPSAMKAGSVGYVMANFPKVIDASAQGFADTAGQAGIDFHDITGQWAADLKNEWDQIRNTPGTWIYEKVSKAGSWVAGVLNGALGGAAKQIFGGDYDLKSQLGDMGVTKIAEEAENIKKSMEAWRIPSMEETKEMFAGWNKNFNDWKNGLDIPTKIEPPTVNGEPIIAYMAGKAAEANNWINEKGQAMLDKLGTIIPPFNEWTWDTAELDTKITKIKEDMKDWRLDIDTAQAKANLQELNDWFNREIKDQMTKWRLDVDTNQAKENLQELNDWFNREIKDQVTKWTLDLNTDQAKANGIEFNEWFNREVKDQVSTWNLTDTFASMKTEWNNFVEYAGTHFTNGAKVWGSALIEKLKGGIKDVANLLEYWVTGKDRKKEDREAEKQKQIALAQQQGMSLTEATSQAETLAQSEEPSGPTFTETFSKLGQSIWKGFVNALHAGIDSILESMKSLGGAAWDAFIEKIKGAVDEIMNAFSMWGMIAFTLIKEYLDGVYKNLENILNFFVSLYNWFVTLFADFPTTFAEWGEALVNLGKIFTDTISQAFKDTFGEDFVNMFSAENIKTKFSDLGKGIMKGFLNVFDKSPAKKQLTEAQKLEMTPEQQAAYISEEPTDPFEKMKEMGQKIVEGFTDKFKDIKISDDMKEKGKAIIDGFKDSFTTAKIKELFTDLGTSLVDAISTGLDNAKSKFIELFSGLGKAIVGGFMDMFRSGSDKLFPKKKASEADMSGMTEEQKKAYMEPEKTPQEEFAALGTKIWDSFTFALGAGWEVVKAKIGELGTYIWSSFTTAIVSGWEVVKAKIGELGTKIWDSFTFALGAGWEIVKQKFNSIGAKIFGGFWDKINSASDWLALMAKFLEAGQKIMSGLWSKLTDPTFWANLVNKFSSVGKEIMNSFWNAFCAKWSELVTWFNSLGSKIFDGFKACFSGDTAYRNGHLYIAGAKIFAQGGDVMADSKAGNTASIFASLGALRAANGINSVPGVGISDTVPILARAGERVLTPQQARAMDSGAGSVVLNISINVSPGTKSVDKTDIKEMGERIIEYIKRESKNGRNILRPAGVY